MPSSWDQQSFLGLRGHPMKTTISKEGYAFLQICQRPGSWWSQSGLLVAVSFSPYPKYLVDGGYHSKHPDKRPRLTPYQRHCRRMLAHGHHWSNVIYADCYYLDYTAVSWTSHMTFEVVTCGTPVVDDISIWESTRPDNQRFISIITSWILVNMIPTLVWHGNLHTTTSHS